MTPLPISVFYIASSEEDRIAASLASVSGWASEVIVVLGNCDDPTAHVARKFGARVFINPWLGYGSQKRFAEDQCKHTWLLNIDADEVLSLELKSEIEKLFQNETSADAYRIPIRFQFAFEHKPKLNAYFNDPPRLYDRTKARFRDHPTFDTVVPHNESTPWRVAKLNGEIHHCSFRNLSHFVTKINEYSDMQSQDLYKRGRKPSAIRVLMEPIIAFPKCYIGRRYYLYGTHGVTYALLWAVMRMVRLAKTRELFLLAAHTQRNSYLSQMNKL